MFFKTPCDEMRNTHQAVLLHTDIMSVVSRKSTFEIMTKRQTVII